MARNGNDFAKRINQHVGARLKLARENCGISQTDAAAALNLKYQQIQKNERGIDRISAGALFVLAELYDRPIQWFFEGVEA